MTEQVSRSPKLASIAASVAARRFLKKVDHYARYWNAPTHRAAWVRGDPCVYCYGLFGATETVDHIQPKARGGTDRWYNLAAACSRCNSSKGKRTLLAHLLTGRAVSIRGGAWLTQL